MGGGGGSERQRQMQPDRRSDGAGGEGAVEHPGVSQTR